MVVRHRVARRRRLFGLLFALCLGAFALAWVALFVSEQRVTAESAHAARRGEVSVARPLTNPIVTENSLPGTDSWKYIQDFNINILQAYAGATSVNAGQPINIHVKADGGGIATLRSRLYRLGYYQDRGARLYQTTTGIAITPNQPNCTRNSSTGLVRCPWASTYTINTDSAWLSGIYLVQIDGMNSSNNPVYTFYVYFVLRNDGSPAPILVQEASKTNQAYNDYGGESLYVSRNNEGRPRAFQVSFDRPYATGAGTGDKFFAYAVDAVRWLEASGYHVTYLSDVDRAANPALLLNHQVFMTMGHDEYWSWAERDAVEAARDAGVNLVFASANETYWNIRLESSPVGPNRIITCYKQAGPEMTTTPAPPPPQLTTRFRDPQIDRPENALTGGNYQSYYNDELYRAPWVLYGSPSRWYFDCTGFQPGDVVNNIVGEEWNATVNNGRQPATTEILSRGVVHDPQGLPTLQETTIYTAPSGAKVFGAASIHFSWGLIDHVNRPTAVATIPVPFGRAWLSNDADHRMAQLMANILDNFTGAWDGAPRPCGPPYHFYTVGPRATRTSMPQPPSATGTPPTATRTPTRTPTTVPQNTATPTHTRTATHTPTPSAPNTATRTPTWTPTNVPTNTATNTPTWTPTNVATGVPTSTATNTPVVPPGTPTHTPTSPPGGTTPTATATGLVVTPTPPPCALSFVDVPTGSPFYPFIQWMACRGYISGYTCGGPGEPCPGSYFRPGNAVTRGQMLKMVVNTAGWNYISPPAPTFADVDLTHPFYMFIETGYARGVISGYDCGGPGEPCDPQNRPYFRPYNNITRGQLSKVIALARAYPLPNPPAPTFADVPPGDPFYAFIEAMAAHNIVSGYDCGAPGEPCDPQNRPYFRPANQATRGQVTKFVTLAYGGP
jgi:hypothetical protein